MRLGALEAGGTKMVCAVGDENGQIFEEITIPTLSPELTIPRIIEYFRNKRLDALGIGCFGPIDLKTDSPTYGFITSTPKSGWSNYNIVGALKNALGIPVGFDTDVNASCIGEVTWGALKGYNSGIYLTIGTGIGAGIYSEGKLLHNMLHPEAGHILLTKHPKDHYHGNCPFHNCCLEGVASGPAIADRWKEPADSLSLKTQVWEIEAYYIAQALVNYILTVSPMKIILGGGVMHQRQLFPLIRENVIYMLNDYIQTDEIKNIENYITSAALGDKQGIMGCLKLAMMAL